MNAIHSPRLSFFLCRFTQHAIALTALSSAACGPVEDPLILPVLPGVASSTQQPSSTARPSSALTSSPSALATANPVPAEPGEPCGLSISVERGAIPTVGIAKINGLEEDATDAYVEFGKDTHYGMRAPIEPQYVDNTFLLGMESGGSYHYRVVAQQDGKACSTPDATFAAGAVDVSTTSGLKITGVGSPGFVTNAQMQNKGIVFILNEAGKAVWSYSSVKMPSCARQSYNGRYMWIVKVNVPDSGGQFHRVAMDGSDPTDFSEQFGASHHDFTVLPDERVAYLAYGKSVAGKNCDDIKLFDPAENTTTTVANIADINGASGNCHANAIQYSPEDETLVVSDLDDNSFSKITLTGEKVWTFGGANSDFTGDQWTRQHNFHMLSKDKLVFFNNGATGPNSPSLAQEITLDPEAQTWELGWNYTASPGIDNDIMGDTQRLANGNTLVTYSAAGKIHEVDAKGKLVQSIEAQSNQFGYSEKRLSLYGAPSR